MKFIYRLIIWFKSLLGAPDAVLAHKIILRKVSNLHIYGMGLIGDELLHLLIKAGVANRVIALYDSKAEYNAFETRGYVVKGPADLSLTDMDTLVVASVQFEKQILEQLAPKVNQATLVTVSN